MSENENGFITQTEVTQADGMAERATAKEMIIRQKGNRKKKITVGADKAYDTRDHVDDLRELGVTPHVAGKKKGTAIEDAPSGMPVTNKASGTERRSKSTLAGPR